MTQDKQWTRDEIDMAAFGASDAACYEYPGKNQQAERLAFCAGAAHAVSSITQDPSPAVAGEGEPNLGRANSYEAGQLLFNAFRTFLGSAGIDSSQCNFVIELPDRDAHKHIRRAPDQGEQPKGRPDEFRCHA